MRSRPLKFPHLATLDEVHSLGVLWSVSRPSSVWQLTERVLAREPKEGFPRVYLLGSEDLGCTLSERRWLRVHAERLFARRGCSSAVDLVIGNPGVGPPLFAALRLHEDADLPFGWYVLSDAAAASAAAWFGRLYHEHAPEEGEATEQGYRFRKRYLAQVQETPETAEF